MNSLFSLFHPPFPMMLIGAAVIGLCAGTYFFFHGFALLQRRRLILDTPLSKIRSASLGMVEVSGQAVGPYTIMAPISERPCYYHHTLVWEWKKEGDDKKWVKVADERVHVPFFLDDNTGRVLIDPRGAELDIHRDSQEEFSDAVFATKEAVPSNVFRFLANHGIEPSTRIKVEEYCIKPKNSLFILGTLAENPGLEVTSKPVRETETQQGFGFSFGLSLTATSSSSSAPLSSLDASVPSFKVHRNPIEALPTSPQRPQVIRLTPDGQPKGEMTQQQRITAALLKAGITNPIAWEVAGVSQPGAQSAAAAAPAPVTKQAQNTEHEGEPQGFDPHPAVVLMKGSNNQSFMISWRSQEKVAHSLGWKSALMIWGGPALALPCLYLILQVLRLL